MTTAEPELTVLAEAVDALMRYDADNGYGLFELDRSGAEAAAAVVLRTATARFLAHAQQCRGRQRDASNLGQSWDLFQRAVEAERVAEVLTRGIPEETTGAHGALPEEKTNV